MRKFDESKSYGEQDWMEKSSFNQAVAYMIRLDYICKVINVCAGNEDYNNWFLQLKRLYIELHPRLRKQSAKTDEEGLNTEELRECKKFVDKLTKVSMDYKKLETQARLTGRAVNSAVPTQFGRLLEEFEIYLRDCMNKKDLLLPAASDPLHNMF